MAHDDQFTATGPAFTGSGFPKAAFSTGREGTDCTYGVNVQGSKCGVYGESGLVPDSSRQPPANYRDSVGVCGVGQSYGVYGDGGAIAGVYGQHENSGAGVIGVGLKKNNGVFGVSKRYKEISGEGVGVRGASECLEGCGVKGLSVKEFSSNGPLSATVADGSGTGVMGESGSGTGVMGRSNTGVGGVFTSNFAQIRLKPATTLGPPKTGSHERGEFFVDAKGALYYCIDESPLHWQKLAGRSAFEELFEDIGNAILNLFFRK